MAMLSLPSTGLILDHNGPGKGPFDGGGQDQDNLLASLMEKLKMTSKQVKAWSEERLKIRDAMAVYKNTDNVDPERLQKCLENIKKAITVSSLPAMVERLEALARPINLKVMSTPEGNIFISSDTFYVEVIMGENGNVKDVMVAHCKDPLSCPEMCEALGQSNFKEFSEHLRGLTEFYQAGGDAAQKSNAFNSLQCLEKDLLTILSITKKPGSTPLTVVKNSLGYCTPRTGGHHMRLTYFISPYDLLDVEQEQSKEIGPDDPLPKDIGLWVSIGLENSQPRKLQTAPLIVPTTTEGKLTGNSATLGPNNSVVLPAVFSLNLSQEMPLSVTLLKQLQALVGVSIVPYGEPPTALPLNTLICRHTLNPNFATDQQERNIPHPRGYTFHVNLPDQKQRYYVTDSPMVGDIRGILISKIHFSQHSQVIQTINCLRKQANYNTLIASCVRKNSQENDESEEVFEVTAYHHHKMTVLFEHPDKDGMACVEFDTSDAASPKCKLYAREGEEPFCSEEYATKVLQKCLSIPITMRAILKKTDEWLKTRKRKEVPAAATPAMGPSLFPSQQVAPSSGPFSTLQKLAKQPFGGSIGSSYNTAAKLKDPMNMSPPQKFTGSILGDLKSFATFFPPSSSGYIAPPSATSPSGDPLLSPTKPSHNPMLTSLLQGTTSGGGPLAQKIPIQHVTHHGAPPPGTPTSPSLQPKPHKHPMLLNLLQEQNMDPSLSTSLQGNKVKKRRKRPSEKSPRLLGEEEGAQSGREGPQDVFAFTKLSSMPLLQPQSSPVSTAAEMFSTFDPNKPTQTLTEFCALLSKPPPTDQGGKMGKKLPSRSDSIGSISGLSTTIAPSPRQSPKTPLSPPVSSGPISRPSRSINSTPELPTPSPSVIQAPSPNILPCPSPGILASPSTTALPSPSPNILPSPNPNILPAPSPNVLPGMITEMLPKSDPLPEITPALTQDHRISPKVLTTPSHQPPEDPFDFNEDLIHKNVPNFDDMFISPKQDAEEYSVNSAIAKLESATGLDDSEDNSEKGVSALLSMTTVPPIKPTLTATRTLSLDLPSTSSIRASGQSTLDMKKNENTTDSGTPSGKELRSPLAPPMESPLPSPKKNASKSHTSKGKPKNFAVEGVGSFQTDAAKAKPKRSKKALKEPSGPSDQAAPKKGRKRKKKGRGRYNDSSPECSTTEDYETTVRSEQPLKMTIRVKPVIEPKPKAKGSPPVPPKIKVKALPALDSTATPSPVQKEDPSSEQSARTPTVAAPQVHPTPAKRDSDDSKKDKAEARADVVPGKKDSTDGAKADPPEPVVTRKVPEIQRPHGENKKGSDNRPLSKLQSKSGLKTASGLKVASKGRGDGPRRQSQGTKAEARKPSPQDILSSILPKAVVSYKIPKLPKKHSSQDATPKVGPEGDGGGLLTELLKKVAPASTNIKGSDPGRLASPKRTPNTSLQRPRSASPSIRYDPSKRFELGRGTTFTKPVPGPKGGSISPRASVSPQGGFGGKARAGGSPMEAASSPTYRRTPSPQLRMPPSTSTSPGLPKSSSGPTGAKSTQSHSPNHGPKSTQGHSPSHGPKNSGGSNPPTNAKVRPTGTANASLNRAGSSPSQLAKSSPNHPSRSSPNTTTSTGPDKTPTTSVMSRSATSTPVKTSQASRPSQGPPIQQTKGSARPPPLNLSHSTKQPTSGASPDGRASSPASTAPQTPTSATLSGPRIRSPPPKPRKTASLSAIVSKLTERVQVKTVIDGPLERSDDQKKTELAGDKDEVVRALISSGHVEKVPLVSSSKTATTTKNSVKEDSAKTALSTKCAAPKISQTKTAVAQVLKNIAQASKQETHSASKTNVSPAAKPGIPLKTSQSNKANVSSSTTKTVTTKASNPSEGKGNVQHRSDSAGNKATAAHPRGPQPGSRATGMNKTGAAVTGKPKIVVPPASKSNQPPQGPGGKVQGKPSQSPTSNKPIILSKSSSTVTSPDKGATKVTRVQIAPVATPLAAPVGPKGQPPSKPSQEQKNAAAADQKGSNPKGASNKLDKGKAPSGKDENKRSVDPTKKEFAQPKVSPQPKDWKEGACNPQEKDQAHLKRNQVRPPPELGASQENKKDDKKVADKKQANAEKLPGKPSLKRTVSIDGGIEMPKKILKVSLSHDEVTLAQSAPGGGLGPLSPKAVTKVPQKLAIPKSSPTASNKMAGQTGKSPAPSIPTDNDFKVPSPGMLPPSPRNMIHGVRSPGLSFKPSSPPKATSPVSPGIPSPESSGAAVGGVPSPQGVKRAATPLEAALPAKRSMLLESCSPVSPADSDDALVIDSPNSPSIRKPKTLADKVKNESSNRGIHKSPLPQSPLVKSPTLPPIKSPTVSDGSYEAGSPLDDDLMNEALSHVREDSLQET